MYERTIDLENIVYKECDKLIILTKDNLFEVFQLEESNKRKLIGMYYTQEQAFEKVTNKTESKRSVDNCMPNKIQTLFNKYKL